LVKNAKVRKLTAVSILLILHAFHSNVFSQVKIGGNPSSISKSSILELESNSQGLLIPRMSDTLLINAVNPPDGTLIYLQSANPGARGMYLRKNGKWELLYGSPTRTITNFIVNADSSFSLIYNDSTRYTSVLKLGSASGSSSSGSGIVWKGTLSAPPATPQVNWAFYDSVQHKSFIFDGTTWKVIAQDGIAGGSLTWGGMGSLPPSAPLTNTVYFNTTDKVLYYWDGSTWKAIGTNTQGQLPIVWKGSLTSAPSNPQLNWAYYNIADKKSYLWDGLGWQMLTQDGNQGPQGTPGIQGLQGLGISWKGSLSTPPTGQQLNWAYYNTTDKKSYLWDGLSWQIITQDGVAGPIGAQGPPGPNAITWKGSLLTAPASPLLYWAYYNLTDRKSYIWDGSAWQILAMDGGQGPAGPNAITWQGSLAAAPSNPLLNWAYYNTTVKKSFLWDGSTWQVLSQDGVQGPPGPNAITWRGSLSTAPASPLLYWAYYNTTDKRSYIWDGTAWQILAIDGANGPTGGQGPQGQAGISLVWQGSFNTAPSSQQLNWAYYNIADKRSYVWNGSSWQIVAQDGLPGPAGPQGPAGPNAITWKGSLTSPPASPLLYWAYYNSTDRKSYIWDGSVWQVLAVDGNQGPAGPNAITWQGSLASPPVNPLLYWAYHNTVDKKSYLWDGLTWQILSEDGVQGPPGPNAISWKGSLLAAPASPLLYWAYYNITDKKSYIWDGNLWQILSIDGSSGATGPQGPSGQNGVSLVWKGSLNSAPPSPQTNWAYYNSSDKKSYVFDGSGWQVLAQDGLTGTTGQNGLSLTWKGSLATAPASPQTNWAYYNSIDKKSYVFDGSLWQVLAQDGEKSYSTVSTGSSGINLNASINLDTLKINIPDAAPDIQRGLVNQGGQQFGGAKTFIDGVYIDDGLAVRGVSVFNPSASKLSLGISSSSPAAPPQTKYLTVDASGSVMLAEGSSLAKFHETVLFPFFSVNANAYADIVVTLGVDQNFLESTLVVNPDAELPAGIVIAWCRAIKGTKTIKVRFYNYTSSFISVNQTNFMVHVQ
jgi:hypothetical protein